jgi:hypothetical protein
MVKLFKKKQRPLDDDEDTYHESIQDIAAERSGGWRLLKFGVPSLIGLTGIALLVMSYLWDADTPFMHPYQFDVWQKALLRADGDDKVLKKTGIVTTSTVIELVSTLLDKPGGFLSNDITPPGILMDNTHNWEFGVVQQVRDFTRSLRNDFTRSQSQSMEDRDLGIAEPALNNDTTSWLFPSTEDRFGEGRQRLVNYLNRLKDPNDRDGEFYARADNLREWLQVAGRRLGGLSQRLSASVGQSRISDFNAEEAELAPGTERPGQGMVKTPWMQIDDVFYEARGTAFALLHLLKAVEIDFAPVLSNKNATVSLRQIIRELESTQDTMWSPLVLNGTGFGAFANHSLVMGSYIARANAAIIDLTNLLSQG